MSDEGSAAVIFSLERPDVAALEALWTGLEPRCEINFYLSWSWIGPWLAEAGPPDFILVGRSGGEIVCLGLFRRSIQRRHGFVRSRALHLHETGSQQQDSIVIEYNGLLTDRRFGRLEAQAIAFLRSNAVETGRFDEVQLGGIAEEVHEVLGQAGLATYVRAKKATAFVDLEKVRASDGGYLATLSANTRYQIRRALKIYEGRGALALEPARSTGEALLFFDLLGELHEEAWRKRGKEGAWSYPFLVAFHRRVIETSFTEGGIEIVRISCGGTPIGYIHCLIHGGWIGSYLSGFAYEPDNKVKPGLVSFYLYIEHRMKAGGEIFDFLAGDHRYKASLGEPGANMYWVQVAEPRWHLRLENALRRVKRRAQSLLGRSPAEDQAS
ncbi:GNAT family N-acetyltransferase [Allosphingosinicella sp.]|uniref:GNAT family N-acetyltransferase n=1 Tax=Allosphingosinicella sp. TaxID=2823234 RepID=UPI002F09824C